ncbi:LIP [Symbiodinium sp. KB8]|nr:LIP [Symbiodinium sp. KB8]
MVYLSGAAYCSKSTVEAWNCGQACSSVQVSSPTYVYDAGLNVAGYVGQLMTGEILVSFRGTQPSSLKDWIDDLKFVKTEPYPYCTKCEVHKGFYQSWNALKSQVLNAIDGFGGGPIVVTGHSLGAAMAALCAFDLKGYSVEHVYTFGQPRVGDTNFASTFGQDIQNNFRMILCLICPLKTWDSTILAQVWCCLVSLATRSTLLNHVVFLPTPSSSISTEVFYTEDSSEYTVCNSSGEDPNCSDGQLITLSISDHLHYLDLPISGMCSDPADAPVPNYWIEEEREASAGAAVTSPSLRGSQ